MKSSVHLAFLTALAIAAGCSNASETDPGAHRAGVQIVSTTLDLSEFDLCWQVDGSELRVELDREMLDSAGTRILDLPRGTGLEVALVEPGQGCEAQAAKNVLLEPSVVGAAEEAVLYLSEEPSGGVHGALVPVASSEGFDEVSLRGGGCNGAAPYAHRETVTSSGGGCSTRARLYECQTFWLGGPVGESLSGYVETYDSGWVDCSDACLSS